MQSFQELPDEPLSSDSAHSEILKMLHQGFEEVSALCQHLDYQITVSTCIYICNKCLEQVYTCVTQYGSAVYIGIAMVYPVYIYKVFHHFHFRFAGLLST